MLRAAVASQNEFEKILYSFERLTELSEHNQTELHYNLLFNHEKTQDESFQLPEINISLDQAYIRESPQ